MGWSRTAVVVALVVTSACGGDGGTGGTGSTDSTGSAGDRELSGELLVSAAASLTDAFHELGTAFEEAHPDLTVTFNHAASSTLATQMAEGAPADVFAAADPIQMDVVDDEGLVEERAVFTTTRLGIVVEAGNPLGIETLSDLTDDEVVLVLAAPEVPAGRSAAAMLEAEGIAVTPSSLEVDVRATLGRVELGEADAAIVYRSDIVTAEDTVEGVAIPDDQNVVVEYPIAASVAARNPDAADAFIAFVRGPDGQAALAAAGFGS
jgi:molybdate transport system substrate-binding protein